MRDLLNKESGHFSCQSPYTNSQPHCESPSTSTAQSQHTNKDFVILHTLTEPSGQAANSLSELVSDVLSGLSEEWKDKRNVVMLSTWHNNSMQNMRRKVKNNVEQFRKPVVICDYTKHVGGVDVSDQYISSYGFTRKSKNGGIKCFSVRWRWQW